MDIQAELSQIFSQRSSGPFLFIGSGFSRRYVGLEDWAGLLKKFCVTGKPYGYYKGKANQYTPLIARFIAEDFHQYWWTDGLYEQSRKGFGDRVEDQTSPMRFEVCKHLMEVSKKNDIDASLQEELAILADCDVDGIITTNWDVLIEKLFPEYKVYIGQQELLFSNPLSMAEIYKIHGCATKPDSLVLTDKDYEDYNGRNAYLASKLITIFVEHPVVFVGYSISDPNIQELLKSISLCIGPENIKQLQNNLIFVDRNEPEEGPTIETSSLQFDTVQVPIKIVKTSDFSSVYSAISAFERKLPARVLRFCKEQVFEIVKSTNPETKMAVVDFDSVKDSREVEVVFGLGVMGKIGEQGYVAITLHDLFIDLINDEKEYDPVKLLEITFPGLPDKIKYVPIFKYLNAMNIKSLDDYKKSGIKLDHLAIRDRSDYFSSSATAITTERFSQMSCEDFLKNRSKNEITSYFPAIKNPNLETFQAYLRDHMTELDSSNKYHFRRLLAYYDYLKYGF